MRFTRFFLVAILVLGAGRTAASQEPKTHTKKSASAWSDSMRRFVAEKGSTERTWASRSNDSRRVADATNVEDTCLALHTLVVARDEKRSDSTHLVSQSTCTPARQFQMKSAVVNSDEQK